MKKQLILTAGIVLSACSSNGQNSNSNQHGFNAPQNMAGQYQMAGYNHPMAAQHQMPALRTGGCAPSPAPTPCSMAAQRVVSPCGPTPAPVSPCAQAQMAQYAQGGVRGGGFPWALGGAAAGAGAIALLAGGSPSYVPGKPFISPPTGGGVKDETGTPTTGGPRPLNPMPLIPLTNGPLVLTPTIGDPRALVPITETNTGTLTNNVTKGRMMNPAFMGGMNRMAGQHGLRSSYVAPKPSYAYGEVGAVNQDAGKSLGGVQGRIGYQSAFVVGGELEGSIGVTKAKNLTVDDLAVGETKMTSVKNSMAGFATARVPLGSSVKALARVGVHNTKASYASGCETGGGEETGTGEGTTSGEETGTGTTTGTTTGTGGVRPLGRMMGECEGGVSKSTDSHTGVAFGAGLEAALTPVDSIRADVTAYDMGDSFRKAISVGYLRKF